VALLVVSGLSVAGDAAPVAADPALSLRSSYVRGLGAYNSQGSIDQLMSSPALGDVTGDGYPEVVVGGMDGRVTISNPDNGGVFHVIDVDLGSMIQASPGLVNIDGDPALEIVVAFVRRIAGASGVRIYDDLGHGAGLRFNQGSSPAAPDSGFFATPAVGDVNGDGTLDVVAGGFDQRVHAWSLSGAPLPGFPRFTFDTMLSSPALADIDGNGVLDIVIGGDMDFGQPLPAGGYLWAFRGDGSDLPGYPFRLSGEVIWSSPAVGDVDADGDLDIVVGTGRNFGANPDQRFLFAVDGRSRAALPGWPKVLDANTMGSPALADLDGDPGREVVTISGSGRVYSFDSNGTERWQHCARAPWASSCPGDAAILASPVIANVDGDGTFEVVATMERELVVLDGGSGRREATTAVYPPGIAWAGANAPAVATVGGTTLIAAHVLVDNGDNRRGAGDSQAVMTFSTPGGSASQPWAHFKGSAARPGRYRPASNIDFGRYVDAVYRDLLGRPVDGTGRTYWSSLLDNGMPPGAFTRQIAVAPEWLGHTVDVLYREVFGRSPDPSGLNYWIGVLARGNRVAAVASNLYGSDEWFFSHGGNNNSFVDALYRAILRREPDSGRSYWLGLLAQGRTRADIAGAFYTTYESNARRVDRLYAELMKRAVDPAGRDYWANQLVVVDDIALAALLTSSPEYMFRTAAK
jgi:hypothetical protein